MCVFEKIPYQGSKSLSLSLSLSRGGGGGVLLGLSTPHSPAVAFVFWKDSDCFVKAGGYKLPSCRWIIHIQYSGYMIHVYIYRKIQIPHIVSIKAVEETDDMIYLLSFNFSCKGLGYNELTYSLHWRR